MGCFGGHDIVTGMGVAHRERAAAFRIGAGSVTFLRERGIVR
ncbi:MAG: hypothetical protein ACTXOO_04400 [Sodalis sp. (in: enterobacteria)]